MVASRVLLFLELIIKIFSDNMEALKIKLSRRHKESKYASCKTLEYGLNS